MFLTYCKDTSYFLITNYIAFKITGQTHEKIPQDMSCFSVWQDLNIDRQRLQGTVYETCAGHLACIAGGEKEAHIQ
jgi:hypothetical protein